MNYFVSTHADGRVAPICLDWIREDGTSAVHGYTLAEVETYYPNVKIMTAEEFALLQESVSCTDPVEITAEKFDEMLNVLPPMKWCRGESAESFMMSEFMTGRITGIYCRLGGRYFSFYGLCTMSHVDIVAKCAAARDAANG